MHPLHTKLSLLLICFYIISCGSSGEQEDETSSLGDGAGTSEQPFENSPLLTLSDASVSFSVSGPATQSENKTITVTNLGEVESPAITALAIDGEDKDHFTFEDVDCLGKAIAIGDSCSFAVKAQIASNGSKSASLKVVADLHSSSSLDLNVSGSGFVVGLELTGADISNVVVDGDEGASSWELTLQNLGTGTSGPLENVVLTAGVADQFEIINNNCSGVSLRANDSCKFIVRSQLSTDISFDGSLSIGDGTNSTILKTLRGRSFGYQNFVSTWNTNNTSTGSSANNQITLPLEATGTYDFRVKWGDGSSDLINAHDAAEVTHTYAIPGTYLVTISGDLNGFRFNDSGDKLKLTDISAWGGHINLGNNGAYFYGCSNLTGSATDSPDLSGTTNLSFTFANPTVTNEFRMDVSSWDVSSVSNFEAMFLRAVHFNADLSSWNMQSATNLKEMFRTSVIFNQDISSWNTSNVVNMQAMFHTAQEFNQNIDSWDVSSVEIFTSMFFGATVFNQSLNSWQLDSADILAFMFQNTDAFNGDITQWDTSNATNFYGMFRGAVAFNQDIGGWNTANVTSMSEMFKDNGGAFDQDIGDWNIENVTDFLRMFENSGMSQSSYDALLIGWSAQNVSANETFDAGNSHTRQERQRPHIVI